MKEKRPSPLRKIRKKEETGQKMIGKKRGKRKLRDKPHLNVPG